MLIRAAATGTDTYEENRNLLLTDGARADSVPNLEIETGEVIGAGHASTTGRFDDEQLFYLMARGIPEAEARRSSSAASSPRSSTGSASPRSATGCSPRSSVSWATPDDARASSGSAALVGSRRRHARRTSRSAARRSASRASRARSWRCSTSARTPRSSLSDGEVERRHGRVLAARLAVRPAHRQAHRTARHRGSAGLSRTNRRRRHLRRREGVSAMATLEIKDLHVTVAADGDGSEPREILKRCRPDRQAGRDPRDHGPERVGQVDARLLHRRSPALHGHRRHRDPRRRGRPRDDRRRARPRRAVPRDAVPGRGSRRQRHELPSYGGHRGHRRGAEAADLDQGAQRGVRAARRSTRRSCSGRSTRASPVARRSASRCCSSSCSSRRSRSSTRPTPASTSMRCGSCRPASTGSARPAPPARC